MKQTDGWQGELLYIKFLKKKRKAALMWIALLYAKAYLFKRPSSMDDKKAIWKWLLSV